MSSRRPPSSFYEKGYHEVTTRELDEAAGLTKSALYYYIGQKEEALFQIHQKGDGCRHQ